MAATLVHRGPDDHGVWVDPAVGLALGFRRLSIVDLSETGHQPMVSSDHRFVIVFNGEIYNHADVRRDLVGRGHRFRGSSDTEVILEAVSAWGFEATLPRLNGMFAIALWDAQQRRLWLARDRLGKKPLYYGRVDGIWLFGSSSRAFVRIPPVRRRSTLTPSTLISSWGMSPPRFQCSRGSRSCRRPVSSV